MAGHEIGNHTMSHPIPAALADEPVEWCYERMTFDTYQADVLAAQHVVLSEEAVARLEEKLGK